LEEKFSQDDLGQACDDLGTIPYFPRESRSSVIFQLAKMCPHRRSLKWLVETALARCKGWPGMSELRGLLCTRFDAADGIDEPNCSIPGFTAEEAEMRHIEEHDNRKRGELSGEAVAMIQEAAKRMKRLGAA